ncbi:hypothetical protein N8D56_19595 [Devosia sp. A8/3-2]|nr:hypothetical protein N8D56_19595 [Devosia sp. A8/3-2]
MQLLEEFAEQLNATPIPEGEIFRSTHLDVDCDAKVYAIAAEVTEYVHTMDSVLPHILDDALSSYTARVCAADSLNRLLQMGWTVTPDLRLNDAFIRPTAVVKTCEAAVPTNDGNT